MPRVAPDRPVEPPTGHPDPSARREVPGAGDLRQQTETVHAFRRHALFDSHGPGTRAHHGRGRLTARERLDLLFDPGTFHEIEALRRHRAQGFGLEHNRPHTDGVVTGWGQVHGQRVFAFAHDARIFGGALGEAHAEKIHKLIDLAIDARCPLVGINDGGGARIQEGVSALAGFGGIFQRHVRASGLIPQFSVMVGPCAGGASYAPALTDFVFAVRGAAKMFITGPSVVSAVTGERVSMEELGGADVHAEVSGVVTQAYDDEASCFEDLRYLLSLLPRGRGFAPVDYGVSDPTDRECPELLDLVPADLRMPYDVGDVIETIVDDQEFFEIQPAWGRSLVCGLGRFAGRTVGIVANQPQHLAGALDADASQKGAHFVSFCDAFDIPLVTLVDVPGFLPGVDQEHGGIIRHGAKLIAAYCSATVPRIQVILRKAFGGAYIVMDSRSVGADLSFAWPANVVAVMGAEGGVDIIHRKELALAGDREARAAELRADYSEALMNPFCAAERGLVDDIIRPQDTRRVLCEALAVLQDKSTFGDRSVRKHAVANL